MLKKFFGLTIAIVAILIVAYDDFDYVYANVMSSLLAFVSFKEQIQHISERELSLCNGEPGSDCLYLSILGQVFDISKGRKHYGPGGGYHFFAGKDASRAFVTGDFTEAGLTDDASGLLPSQIVALHDWLAFYQRDYKLVGRLIGRYYSETGRPTEALQQVKAALAEGLKLKGLTEAESKRFPSCNSEWSDALGGRVWCSTKSGGVHRNWVGVPRKLYSPGSGSSRCVCVQSSDPKQLDSPTLQEYEDCPLLAESCVIKSI